MDQIEKQRQGYQQHLEATWKRSLVKAFGPEPPLSRTWIDPYDCEDILRHFMDGNYSFLPPNGHLPLYGVEVHEDG